MDRLSKSEWLEHGLTTLANAGFTALKADTLCKALGVSRGSFYWHFKNLADFHTTLLNYWQTQQINNTVVNLESGGATPEEKLTQLFKLSLQGQPALERAIRSWATHNAQVADALRDADEKSMGYIAQLLSETGLPVEIAQQRALVLYLSYIGNVVAGEQLIRHAPHTLVDTLMALALAPHTP